MHRTAHVERAQNSKNDNKRCHYRNIMIITINDRKQSVYAFSSSCFILVHARAISSLLWPVITNGNSILHTQQWCQHWEQNSKPLAIWLVLHSSELLVLPPIYSQSFPVFWSIRSQRRKWIYIKTPSALQVLFFPYFYFIPSISFLWNNLFWFVAAA